MDANSGEPWCEADISDLKNELDHGRTSWDLISFRISCYPVSVIDRAWPELCGPLSGTVSTRLIKHRSKAAAASLN